MNESRRDTQYDLYNLILRSWTRNGKDPYYHSQNSLEGGAIWIPIFGKTEADLRSLAFRGT